MADAISIQELIDARTDAKTLEEAVNGDAVTTVLSRLGETYPTLSNALNQIDSKLDSADTQIKQGITNLFENGGLPATPFATKALMTASALVNGDYAIVTDDTVNNGLYVKTAGAWVKSKYMSKVSEIATGVEGSSLVTVEALVNSLSLGFSADDFNLEFSKKGYYTNRGVFSSHADVRSTNNQFLGKGSTLKFRSYVSPSAGAAPVIVVIRDINGLFESYLYTTTGNLGEYIEDTYTAENDCIISVSSYFDGADSSIYAKVELKYSPATTQIAELKKNILPRGVLGGYDSYGYNLGGYYNVRGVFLPGSAARFKSTDKIAVAKGDLISINAQAGGSELALLNLYNSSDVFIKTIKGSAETPNEIVSLSYVAEDDGYIAASSSVETVDIDATKLLVYKNHNNYIVTYSDLENFVTDGSSNNQVITTKTPSWITHVGEASSILLNGASFATSNNGWFELMASSMGVTAINKARPSEGIGHLAIKLYSGELLTQEILNSIDAFIIMHVWNFNVVARKDVTIDGVEYTDEQLESWSAADYEATGWTWLSTAPAKSEQTDATMSAMWDYSLKKIQAIYYEERNNPESDWYQTTTGKPFNIVLTTHWHDARTKFNLSVRKLCEKWGCTLICFDENIGFTKDKLHVSGEQESILYTSGGLGIENIGGVSYGFHPKGGQDEPLMKRMAAIASSVFKVI